MARMRNAGLAGNAASEGPGTQTPPAPKGAARRWKPSAIAQGLHSDLLRRGWRPRVVEGRTFYRRPNGRGAWLDLAHAVIVDHAEKEQ